MPAEQENMHFGLEPPAQLKQTPAFESWPGNICDVKCTLRSGSPAAILSKKPEKMVDYNLEFNSTLSDKI